jgi:3'5'-cyclic nucleotide phosphodiesterase
MRLTSFTVLCYISCLPQPDVVMSVMKLMSRIAQPSCMDEISDREAAATLHDHTYGITSDPLTQFACAFSALIHDVDHQGVSNAQLVKEKVPIAEKYDGRSVAEQNSLDLAWQLLNSPDYKGFCAFLFPTQAELFRFRQLVSAFALSDARVGGVVNHSFGLLRSSKTTGCEFRHGYRYRRQS